MFSLRGYNHVSIIRRKKENFSGAYDAWLAGLHPEDRVQAEKDFQMALSGEKEFDTEFAVWPDKTVHSS
jgi:hypothetical protein